MGGKTPQPGELAPIDIGLEGGLAGIGCGVPEPARDVGGEFVGVAQLQIDAEIAEAGAHAAPITQQMLLAGSLRRDRFVGAADRLGAGLHVGGAVVGGLRLRPERQAANQRATQKQDCRAGARQAASPHGCLGSANAITASPSLVPNVPCPPSTETTNCRPPSA